MKAGLLFGILTFMRLAYGVAFDSPAILDKNKLEPVHIESDEKLIVNRFVNQTRSSQQFIRSFAPTAGPVRRKFPRREIEKSEKRGEKSRDFECFTCNSENGADDTRPCIDKVEKCANGVKSCSTVVFYTTVAVAGNGSQRVRHMRKFCTSPGTAIYHYLMSFPGGSLCQNIDTESSRTNDSNAMAHYRSLSRPPTLTETFPPSILPDNIFNIEAPPTNGEDSDDQRTNEKVLAGPPSIRPPPNGVRNSLEDTGIKHIGRGRAKRGAERVGSADISRGPPAPPHENSSSVLCACSESLCNFGDFQNVLERSLLRNVDTSMEMATNFTSKIDKIAPKVHKPKSDAKVAKLRNK